MPERTNLAAYTEPTPTDGYPGYVSLNREAEGSTTLTVRSTGHGGARVATITLPEAVMVSLAAALTRATAPASFQDRVRAEAAELDERITKLAAFQHTDTFHGLPNDEQDRLLAQLAVMQDYSGCLAERIAAF